MKAKRYTVTDAGVTVQSECKIEDDFILVSDAERYESVIRQAIAALEDAKAWLGDEGATKQRHDADDALSAMREAIREEQR